MRMFPTIIRLTLGCLIFTTFVNYFPVHAQEVSIAGESLQLAAWQPVDNGLLAVSSFNSKSIWLYNSQLELVNTLAVADGYYVYLLRWSPDGGRLAAFADRGGRGKIFIWQQNQSGAFLSLSTIDLTSRASNTVVAWSPDNERIAVIADLRVEIWNAVTGTFIHRIVTPVGVENSGNATDIAWSPDASRIAINTDGYFVHMIDATNYQLSASISANDEFSLGSVAWKPDSTQIAVLSGNTIKIYNTATLTYGQVALLEHNNLSREMAWQENYLATMGEGAEVIIWNTVNWQVHRIIDVNDSLIISISWKHNSTILAYGGYTYGKITLIDSYRSECEPSVATPGELINAINTANVNPDADVIGLEAGTYTFTAPHTPLECAARH